MRKLTTKQLVDFVSQPQFGGDPNRPYDGQAHTFNGAARGQLLLPVHMTMRDLGDVIAEKIRHHQSLQTRFGGALDADAVVQSVLHDLQEEMKLSEVGA